jgi:predicted TIM-barrel fold metal-dependent hydrolase
MPGIDVSAELGEGAWTRADRDGVLRTLQRARLQGMVLASRRALAGELAAGNQELRQAIEGQANLYGWVVVSPADVEGSAQELRRHAGASNILGLRLDTHSAIDKVHSDATLEILNGFRRFTKPALISVRDAADLAGLEELARQIPTLKFIASGAGGDAWQECGAMAKRVVNVLVEPFSGGCHSGKVDALAGRLGYHRILFATGYPNQNPGGALGLLAESKLSDGEKQGILHRNASRLFGLGGEAAAE